MNRITERFYRIKRKRKIKELENKIDVLCERDKFDDELYTKLSDELEELDPYNDMFHLAHVQPGPIVKLKVVKELFVGKTK